MGKIDWQIGFDGFGNVVRQRQILVWEKLTL
jgi:hypothetical protein